MISHRFRVPPRPTSSAPLTPAKAAARRVYANEIQNLIDRKVDAGARRAKESA